jgi:dienelactone hydrolase
MAEVVLFHHALGPSEGITGFAGSLRAAGHTVHTPDLFDGRTFGSIEEGMGYAEQIGFPDEIFKRGAAAVEDLPAQVVYVGFSLGVLPAQMLAQTRAGTRGAVLIYACIPPGEFGGWPAAVPVQIHGMDNDPFFAGEGDVDNAREVVAAATDGELFLYPGDQHYFADPTLPSYDPDAAQLLEKRVLQFLAAR